ncbi:MAG: transcriptional repressor LexA [Bdellovibrionaceae bacterium]|nr:transcriptional repressor LexA [Pseudobdellovibrionaceae bacterium]
MQNLTLNQKKVLDFIKSYRDKNGTPPTYEVIAKHLGYKAKSTVHHYIEALVAKGYMTKENHLSHGLTLHNDGNLLPVLGKVAAGQPIDLKKTDEHLEVPSFMVKGPGPYFALQVSGDSMIGECIQDGDYVIIRQQKTASSGDIVVAEIDDSATIKRFYKKRSHIELHSANEKYKPIIVNESAQLRIAGVYCGLLRTNN